MKNNILQGLELVTDKYINRLFSDRYKRYIPTKDDYAGFFEAYMDGHDGIAQLEENGILSFAEEDDFFHLDKKFKASLKVLDRQSVDEASSKCSWGRKRIERFITRYVSYYTDKRKPDRLFILEQLESVAKENNIVLPTAEEMDKNRSKPKKQQLVVGLVDINTENKVSEYKYYFDGSNVVAYLPGENKAVERELRDRTKWDDLFDTLYPIVKSEYDEKKMSKDNKLLCRGKIEARLIREFYDIYEYDDLTEKETCPEFMSRKLYNKSAAYGERKKRFRRKKDQVRWTAWWTITYDDKLFSSEEQFRRTLLNYFRNKSHPNRGNWRVMGVFEHGEDNGRLHFHGFFYIPQGSEVGELVEVERYSTKRHCMEKYIENTEIRKKFGVNKYEDISEAMSSDVNAMANYTTKMLHYMEKGEKVFYSRHIPMEFVGNFNTHDMLIYFCITCKRPVKRYVINKALLTRTDMSIRRTEEIEVYDEHTPYQNGLLDAA